MRINDYSIIGKCKKCSHPVFRCNHTKHSMNYPTCQHIRVGHIIPDKGGKSGGK